MTFIGIRSRRITDDPAGGVGADTEGGQVAAISCAVVAALPALAYVGRVSGEQDGCFEFAGVHVVVVGTGNAAGLAGLWPVVAARIHADLNCIVDIGFLRDVGKDIVAAVTIGHYERMDVLLTKG